MLKQSLDTKLKATLYALATTRNVMGAIILRDMRTRYFNHGLGFIVVPLWPLVHMIIIITIHTVAHSAVPFGNSPAIFFMTGVIPFLAFSYVSRFMAYSLAMNKSMLAFPVVRVVDILLGRAVLEILSGFITVFFIMLVLSIVGEDPVPYDLECATSAYLSILFLAVSFGFLVGILQMLVPMIFTIYQLMIVAMYATSGVFFSTSMLPDKVGYALSFNPLVGCIEWFRMGFYESYSDKFANAAYIWSVSAGALIIGLVLERVLRRITSEA